MKHIVLALAASFCIGTTVLAQNAAVTNAYMYRKDGKLEQARTEIDKAITHDKTMGNAKTWYFRGEIYEDLANKGGEGTPKDALKIAHQSYEKAVELDKKNGEYANKGAAKLKSMFPMVFNKAVKSLEAKNFDEAIASFEFAKTMRPNDSTTYLYTAYAYESKAESGDKDYKKAKENYYKVIELNPKSLEPYQRLYIITRDIEKNNEEALKVTELALKEFPNNKDFMLAQVNLYIEAGRQNEAISKLEKAIALDAKNANLYAALGSLYDGLNNTEKALANYNKAIEIQPGNFDAQFNMGVYQFNKAAGIYEKVNAMDFATYQKQGKKLEAEAKKYFEQAATYFEKALEIVPTDVSALNSLKTIYTKTGRMDDAKKLDARINAATKK